MPRSTGATIFRRSGEFDKALAVYERIVAEDGQRTKDSTLAQDIYYQLTEQGRRVFFARITLEDKAGTEYEPYIFAALNSARVMVAVGTKPEYFNAVWAKNEWSLFHQQSGINGYFLKCDIRKFFGNIFREILKTRLRKVFAEDRQAGSSWKDPRFESTRRF